MLKLLWLYISLSGFFGFICIYGCDVIVQEEVIIAEESIQQLKAIFVLTYSTTTLSSS
jgi:hypothetical protein